MRVRLKAVLVVVFILNCPRLLSQTQSFDSVWRKLEFQQPVQMLDFQPLQGAEERYSSFSLSQERIGAYSGPRRKNSLRKLKRSQRF